jgi:signal transduction histidine kinase
LIPAVEREVNHSHEKRASLEQVRHLQKLEAMGLLATGIAHDFNNILAAMVLYFSMLKNSKEESTRNYAEKLIQIHSKAVGLVRQILAFSRKQPNAQSHLNLNSSIEEMKEMLTRLLTSRVQIHIDLDPDLKPFTAVKSQMDQVLMNLCVNAKEAMSGAGDLTIATHNVSLEKSEKMTSGELPTGSYVMLSVQDSGAGIEEAVIERIFEPFFTTKGKEKGSGLGLSIVYGIVKAMKGEILVTSALNKGTKFTVYFPLTQEKSSSI